MEVKYDCKDSRKESGIAIVCDESEESVVFVWVQQLCRHEESVVTRQIQNEVWNGIW